METKTIGELKEEIREIEETCENMEHGCNFEITFNYLDDEGNIKTGKIRLNNLRYNEKKKLKSKFLKTLKRILNKQREELFRRVRSWYDEFNEEAQSLSGNIE